MTTSTKEAQQIPKRVSSAEAKAKLSALMARAAHGGERFIIERRGKPMAALISADDFERLQMKSKRRPQGALALRGAWPDATDEEIDSFLADIYAERKKDEDRPPPRLE